MDVTLVIKIPEEVYKAYMHDRSLREFSEDQKSIAENYLIHGLLHGIQLPKGHGTLKDADEFLKITNNYKSGLERLNVDPLVKRGIETIEKFIKEMSPIIEADNAESGDNE